MRVVTRESPNAVYDAQLATFAESGGLFSQQASPGFIEIWSLQSRMASPPARGHRGVGFRHVLQAARLRRSGRAARWSSAASTAHGIGGRSRCSPERLALAGRSASRSPCSSAPPTTDATSPARGGDGLPQRAGSRADSAAARVWDASARGRDAPVPAALTASRSRPSSGCRRAPRRRPRARARPLDRPSRREPSCRRSRCAPAAASARFESLPDARFGRDAASWRGDVPRPGRARCEPTPEALWLDWAERRARRAAGARARRRAAGGRPAPATRAARGRRGGGQVIDRAVLAERRARRAEAAEQAQARVAAEALKAVEVLELRSAELERRLEEAAAERDALSQHGAAVAPAEPDRLALSAALESGARLRAQARDWRVHLRASEVARSADGVHHSPQEESPFAELQAELADAHEAAASARAELERSRDAAVSDLESARGAWERRVVELEAALAGVRGELDAARAAARRPRPPPGRARRGPARGARGPRAPPGRRGRARHPRAGARRLRRGRCRRGRGAPARRDRRPRRARGRARPRARRPRRRWPPTSTPRSPPAPRPRPRSPRCAAIWPP